MRHGWPRRPASWSARTCSPASPPTSSTASATSSSATTAPTRPRSATEGFPKSLCTSVNEVICHGIPDSRVIEDGDIVNIDVTAFINGVHGDTNATFLAGDVDEETKALVERTHEALMRGIAAVKPGRRLNVVGRVIESYAKRFGYGVVRDFTGHGIGTAFHSGLIVPHYDAPMYDDEIQVGMTFTIEPMLNLGTHEWVMWDDGWTVVTKDGRRSAQFEHTLARHTHRRRDPHPRWLRKALARPPSTSDSRRDVDVQAFLVTVRRPTTGWW